MNLRRIEISSDLVLHQNIIKFLNVNYIYILFKSNTICFTEKCMHFYTLLRLKQFSFYVIIYSMNNFKPPRNLLTVYM